MKKVISIHNESIRDANVPNSHVRWASFDIISPKGTVHILRQQKI